MAVVVRLTGLTDLYLLASTSQQMAADATPVKAGIHGKEYRRIGVGIKNPFE